MVVAMTFPIQHAPMIIRHMYFPNKIKKKKGINAINENQRENQNTLSNQYYLELEKGTLSLKIKHKLLEKIQSHTFSSFSNQSKHQAPSLL